jgi:hypothetical protein
LRLDFEPTPVVIPPPPDNTAAAIVVGPFTGPVPLAVVCRLFEQFGPIASAKVLPKPSGIHVRLRFGTPGSAATAVQKRNVVVIGVERVGVALAPAGVVPQRSEPVAVQETVPTRPAAPARAVSERSRPVAAPETVPARPVPAPPAAVAPDDRDEMWRMECPVNAYRDFDAPRASAPERRGWKPLAVLVAQALAESEPAIPVVDFAALSLEEGAGAPDEDQEPAPE